jgi:hypothetical protein
MQICLGRTSFDNDNIGILAPASSRCLVSGTQLDDGRVEIKEMSPLYLTGNMIEK